MSQSHIEKIPEKQPKRTVPFYPFEMGLSSGHHEAEVNILDYWRILWRRKWLIISVFFLTVAVSILFTWIQPNKYTSEVVILPISSGSGSSGMSNMLSQFSSVPVLGTQLSGISEKLGGSKSKELIGILGSRTISENIINQYNLMPIIFSKYYNKKDGTYSRRFFGLRPPPTMDDAVKAFSKSIVKVKQNKKVGMISIQVKMLDPELASRVANGMVIALQDFINNNSLTVEKRNRIFIEEQLVKNGVKILEAGKTLNNFYASNRVSSVVPEMDVNVGRYEETPKTFEDFRESLHLLDKDQNLIQNKITQASVKKVPGQVYLEYLTLNKELLMRIHSLLTQQEEMAKIEESKEDFAFQVIDKARVMQKPSSPRPVLNLAVGVLMGAFLGISLALFLEYIKRLKEKEGDLI